MAVIAGFPANTRHWAIVGSILNQRCCLRHWANFSPTLIIVASVSTTLAQQKTNFRSTFLIETCSLTLVTGYHKQSVTLAEFCFNAGQCRRHWPHSVTCSAIAITVHASSAVQVLFISSRRHRRWDGGSYGFYLRFFFASSFAYNFVRK